MTRTRASLACTAIAALSMLSTPSAAGPLFMPLGDLPGCTYFSGPTDLSADGTVAVGSSSNCSGSEAFRWTQQQGMVGLGHLPGASDPYSHLTRAWGVSADGSIVLGTSGNQLDPETFLWTTTNGMSGLGGSFLGTALSGDGSVASGYANDQAFRWSAGALDPLGDLPGGSAYSRGEGISADGSTVVGGGDGYSGIEAFRWTEGEGMVGLGHLPGDADPNLPGGFHSLATAASADGTVVVGWSSIYDPRVADRREAFRWTDAGGMVGLGSLHGAASEARDVSGNGSIVVGISQNSGFPPNDGAFIWDPTNGMRSVRAVLEAQGLDLTGWTLVSTDAISGDGYTIVGVGYNPSGSYEAWLATIPEPASSLLLAIAVTALGATRRFRS